MLHGTNRLVWLIETTKPKSPQQLGGSELTCWLAEIVCIFYIPTGLKRPPTKLPGIDHLLDFATMLSRPFKLLLCLTIGFTEPNSFSRAGCYNNCSFYSSLHHLSLSHQFRDLLSITPYQFLLLPIVF